MVDNRSAGFFGIGGAFNFKSGDISGTAAKSQDDKMGPGTEYGYIGGEEEEQRQPEFPFVDRSSQLRATLNSLAMMNVANVLKSKKRAEVLNEITDEDKDKDEDKDEDEKEDLDEEFINDFSEDDSNEEENEYY